jgi:hypothetical protein
MKRSPRSDVQRAIEFLSDSDLFGPHGVPLPARPDYQFLARQASDLGHDLPPDAVQQAFRLMMRARLLVMRQR